ncbi:hypothetical protein lerEdw1_018118 [Lerista edwardsae]|nr:hypothetical protein lerEdw1_018118 [Lerista edwardsae]
MIFAFPVLPLSKYAAEWVEDHDESQGIMGHAARVKLNWLFNTKNNRLDVLQLEPNTVYCVTVQIYITPFLLSGDSKENCIATLKDPTFKQTTILLEYILPALLIGLFILASSCCIYRYIHITEQMYPKNLVLKNCNMSQGDVFVPFEKTVVNFISVNMVDQCKILQEDHHFLGSAEHPAEACAHHDAVKEPSKVQEDKRSPDICHSEEALLENEPGGNGPHMTRLRSHDSRGQRQSEDVVVYEFDVRGEYAMPTEEEQGEQCLKEKMGVLEGLLHHSPTAPLGLATDGTEQSSSPQYEIGPPDALSVHKLKELLSNEMDLAPVNLQVPLVNLVIDDQGFCPECGVVTGVCLAHNKKEPFGDEKRVKLREAQTLAFPMTRNATSSSSYYPQFVTWNSQGQAGAEGEHEQNTIIAWDPQTGSPFLPALANFTNKEVPEAEKQGELQEGGILSRQYGRPCSDDLSGGEEETYLLQLKEQWGLQIQIQT